MNFLIGRHYYSYRGHHGAIMYGNRESPAFLHRGITPVDFDHVFSYWNMSAVRILDYTSAWYLAFVFFLDLFFTLLPSFFLL
jgi:hypothetical protein